MINNKNLEIYYIDFGEDNKNGNIHGSPFQMMTAIFGGGGISGEPVSIEYLVERASAREVNKERGYHRISSSEELRQYENANKNDWVIPTPKKGYKIQYYILHPKCKTVKLLIESDSFVDYIEKEQKEELIDYILTHCPCKEIKIDKQEISDNNMNFSHKEEVNGNLNEQLIKGDYYQYSNPVGIKLNEKDREYYWIDTFLKNSIDALSEDGELLQTYTQDYSFGINLQMAKTIGFDVSKAKRYKYTVHIKC